MTEQSGDKPAVTEEKVWDPLTRIFHWALVICFATSFFLGEFGPNIMTLHFWSGYLICGLLAFRLIWGLVGPGPVRFRNIIPGPGAAIAYARTVLSKKPSFWPGHNPLGGLSVVAMLLLLTGQVVTGLFADPEDFVNVGPLAHLVDASWNRMASAWHETLSSALLVLIALHVAVILFYRFWKGEDLIGPMIHGRKKVRRR